jgi:hypothetical protein
MEEEFDALKVMRFLTHLYMGAVLALLVWLAESATRAGG